MEKRRFPRLGIRLGGDIEIAHTVDGAMRRTELAGQVQSVSPQGIGFQMATPAMIYAGTLVKRRAFNTASVSVGLCDSPEMLARRDGT